MTKKIVPHSNLRLLSILGLICVLLVSLTVVVACEEEEEVTYTLTVAVSPSGGGTTSPSAGTHTYDEDTVVTITATAASGYVFDKWSGASTATTATTTVTMTSNKTVTANFEEEAAVEYTLTMAADPAAGGTTTPAVGTHTYDEDTEVTVTATAATGYRFGSWSDNVVDGKVTMDADETVTATFIKTYTLTMAVTPTGGGTTIPTVGTHTYDTGEVVAVTAEEAAHYEFVSWSANVDDGEVTMDADETVTATFAQITHDLTMAVSPEGGGTTTPAEGVNSVAEGTVNITATPTDETWYFLNWSGDDVDDVADPDSASTTITVDADKSIVANFTNITYTLTVAVAGDGSGTTVPAVGAHIYAEGSVVAISATAAGGSQFDGWSGDVAIDATSVTMDADKTITATFTLSGVVGPSVPAVDTEWVYECTYGEIETTTWTYTVTGVASAGAEAWAATGPPANVPAYVLAGDCYVTEVTYSTPPVRETGGATVTITGATNWVSQTTFDNEASLASIDLFEMDVATYMTNTYVGDHGWDYSVNTAWEYEQAGALDPPLPPPTFSSSYEVAVTAGTVEMLGYTCYHITYTLVASDGEPVTPVLEKEEWWCPDITGLVKSINYTGFDEVETLELTSTTA